MVEADHAPQTRRQPSQHSRQSMMPCSEVNVNKTRHTMKCLIRSYKDFIGQNCIA